MGVFAFGLFVFLSFMDSIGQEALKEQQVGKKSVSQDSHLSANSAAPSSKLARSISFEGFTSFLEPISTGRH